MGGSTLLIFIFCFYMTTQCKYSIKHYSQAPLSLWLYQSVISLWRNYGPLFFTCPSVVFYPLLYKNCKLYILNLMYILVKHFFLFPELSLLCWWAEGVIFTFLRVLACKSFLFVDYTAFYTNSRSYSLSFFLAINEALAHKQLGSTGCISTL